MGGSNSITFNPAWLGLLAVAGVSLVVVNGIIPGAGVAIAASIALFFLIDSGAATYLSDQAKALRRRAAL